MSSWWDFVVGWLRLPHHENQNSTILSGRGKVWLIRLIWNQESAGSNPAVLTKLYYNRVCWNGIMLLSDRSDFGSIPNTLTNYSLSFKQKIDVFLGWLHTAQEQLRAFSRRGKSGRFATHLGVEIAGSNPAALTLSRRITKWQRRKQETTKKTSAIC